MAPPHARQFVTARVVTDMSGPYLHSALVASGSAEGVKKDQAAVSDGGLVGRVVEAGEHSARILLLSDLNSRVPVIAEGTREKAILAGSNSSLPTLAYLAADSKIAVGERIVTSGDGGIFPKGLPVGVVTSIDKGVVSVSLFVDPANVEYLSVIDYTF